MRTWMGSQRGPRDHQGRSLRDLDLTRRLFRYPCSYLIDTAAFDGLPGPVKEYVLRRLWASVSRSRWRMHSPKTGSMPERRT